MEIEKLREELRDADLERVNMETELLRLRQEAGLIVLKEGSGSNAFKVIRKKIQESEQKLEDLKILGSSIREAIKIGEKQERQRINAETLKKNLELIEKYKAHLPECPRHKTREGVAFVDAEPYHGAGALPIEFLIFECTSNYLEQHRFSLHRSEIEGLVGKIEEAAKEAAKKAASVIASVF